MPIYEYQCQNCGAQLEVMQKISDAPLTECRVCGGVLEKQWSQTSFQLKGAGWYVSDYGKGGVVPQNKDAKDKDKDSGEKTEKKADTDTAQKSDSEKSPAADTAKADKPATTDKPAAPASKTDS